MNDSIQKLTILCLITCLSVGCGPLEEDSPRVISSGSGAAEVDEVFFATKVSSFEPGEGSGFGASEMPGVVLGAPMGGSARQGSLDVVTLGAGGVITLGFEPQDVRDGPGIDLVIFENAFFYASDDKVFSEPGEVSVSEDGETWVSFPCDEEGVGCAGMTPTKAFDPVGEVLSAQVMGGDGFDLADVGLERARYVRITDRATQGVAPTAGFDLDAVAGVYGISQ